MFAGYNLVFGAMSGHTDNAAHVGGLVSGLILGALIARGAPQHDDAGRRMVTSFARLPAARDKGAGAAYRQQNRAGDSGTSDGGPAATRLFASPLQSRAGL